MKSEKSQFKIENNRLLKMVVISIQILFMLMMPKQVDAATSYTCFPTCSEVDARMMNLFGGDPNFLEGLTSYVGFAASKNSSSIEIGIFDGDSGKTDAGIIDKNNGNWDNTEVQLKYTLLADPAGNGSGTYVVGQWMGNDANPINGALWNASDTTMPNNDWWTVTIQNASQAMSSNGNYFYTLKIEHITPSTIGGSSFKLRSSKDLFIRYKLFSIWGSLATLNDVNIIYPEFDGDWNNLGPSTYDGDWKMYIEKFISGSEFKLWDGDSDHGSDISGTVDTDDPNTSNVDFPYWEVGNSVSLEGAKGLGAPQDDYSNHVYRREPSIVYDIVDSNSNTYSNPNPSGNNEWEKFNIIKGVFNADVMDHSSNNILPSGIYAVNIDGLDLHNTIYLKMYNKVMGVDSNGNPVIAFKPYSVGSTVWVDENNNGVMDEGEAGITGVVVNLLDSNGETIGTTTTDENGEFEFEVEAKTDDPYTGEEIYDGMYSAEVDRSNFDEGGVLEGYGITSGQERITFIVTNDSILGENIGYGVLPATGGNVWIISLIMLLSMVFVLLIKLKTKN